MPPTNGFSSNIARPRPSQTARVIGRPASLASRGSGRTSSGLGQAALDLISAPISVQAQASIAQLPLADMLDRGTSQVSVLRRTLEDAAAVDRVVKQHLADLHQRLEQTGRAQSEMDQRLASAAGGARTLEQAAAALQGLESLIEQLRAMHSGMESSIQHSIQTKLAAQQAESERQIAALTAKLDAAQAASDNRIQTFVKSLDTRLGLLEEQQVEHLSSMDQRVHKTLAGLDAAEQRCRAATGAKVDAMIADMDRRTAQAQARSSLVLDAVSDRVQVLEHQADHAAGIMRDRIESLCATATRLLGIDPRDGRAGHAPDSLLGVVEAAREMIDKIEADTTRLAHLVEEAQTGAAAVREAVALATTAREQARSERDAARLAVQAGVQQLSMYEVALGEAGHRQSMALEEMTGARDRLVTMREDLEVAATATRYHVDQLKDAEAKARDAGGELSLSASEARVRAESLQRAMTDVTAQAESLVGLARDVALLLAKAKAERDGLAA